MLSACEEPGRRQPCRRRAQRVASCREGAARRQHRVSWHDEVEHVSWWDDQVPREAKRVSWGHEAVLGEGPRPAHARQPTSAPPRKLQRSHSVATMTDVVVSDSQKTSDQSPYSGIAAHIGL